jgi:chromosomal replication initiator protein
LRKKALSNGYQIPDDVINYLAGELTEDIRQLSSGLNGVAAKSSLLGTPIDLNLTESVVKNIVRQRKKITIEVIKKLVCKYYNCSLKEVVSRSRKQHLVRPRQRFIYLAAIRMHHSRVSARPLTDTMPLPFIPFVALSGD